MTILLTTIHDPQGKLLDTTANCIDELNELYAGMVAEVTDNTDVNLISLLEASGVIVNLNPAGDIAKSRRSVLMRGLIHYPNGKHHYHFCDFDRLLYWYVFYPVELLNTIAKLPQYDFTIIGRTKKAFNSHPPVQRETERLANLAFSIKFGRSIDILSASRGIAFECGYNLYLSSRAEGPAGIDVEWPLIARHKGYRINYLAVNGLAYESNTFDIKRKPADEWRVRLTNLYQAITTRNGYDG